jgi:hypothetical protein
LGFDTDKDAGRRKSNPYVEVDATEKLQSKKKRTVATGDVGSALRTVYQRTIDEQIPSDLLDLLGKLG